MLHYKIVKSSNFDDERYTEVFVTGVPIFRDHIDALHVAKALNDVIHKSNASQCPDYYKVVDQSYNLNKFKP